MVFFNGLFVLHIERYTDSSIYTARICNGLILKLTGGT
jgi:hypothetical protein